MQMNSFIDLFIQEAIGTIEGLTGEAPKITRGANDATADDIKSPIALVIVDVSGAAQGKLIVAIPPRLATSLVDMMMAGDGESQESMDDDSLDGTKEIISNIAGAMGTALGSQSTLPKLSLSAAGISFVGENEDVDIADFAQIVPLEIKTSAADETIFLLIDASVTEALVPKENDNDLMDDLLSNDDDLIAGAPTSSNLSPEEMKNMGLLREVKLPVTVRIGSKRMLLKDVINMDIGSVVELNQLANDPLDILVDDHVIAQGEVVIVDGNFGIQITHIGTKKDRLNQLKG